MVEVSISSIKCDVHDLGVMDSNLGWIELRVRSTSAEAVLKSFIFSKGFIMSELSSSPHHKRAFNNFSQAQHTGNQS